MTILNQSKIPAVTHSTQFTHKEYFEPAAHGKMISFPRSPLPSGKPDCDWEMLKEEELEWQSWGGRGEQGLGLISAPANFSWGESQLATMVTAPAKTTRDERGVRKKGRSPVICHVLGSFVFHSFSRDLRTKFNFKTKKLLLFIIWNLDCKYRNIENYMEFSLYIYKYTFTSCETF